MSMYDTQREIAEGGILQVLDYWWSKRNVDLHTQIPAKVMAVNYLTNSVTVQPLIKTFLNDKQSLAFQQMIDVPMSLLCNRSKGGARITIPVKVGDVGLLKFSERDPTNWSLGTGDEIVDPVIKDNLSMGVNSYPISFELGLFTKASAIEWDAINIVIAHGDNLILVPPEGNILINGVQITPTGNVITKLGTNLDQLKLDFDAHIHGGVTTGSGSTATPTIP